MAYIILKPLILRGRKCVIGEVVDENMVDEKRVWALKRSGYIAGMEEKELGSHSINGLAAFLLTIPIIQGRERKELTTKPETVVKALEILQMEAKEAMNVIESLEDDEGLIIIHALDNRKTVKEAAASRAKKLEELRREAGKTDESGDA